MSDRAARRRKRRISGDVPPSRPPISRTTLIALAFGGFGLLAIVVVGILVLSGGGGDDTPDPTPTPIPTTTPVPGQDELEIRALAKRSIEALPAGQWPALYDDFNTEFRNRCTLADFTKAGDDASASLGETLQYIAFKTMTTPEITGDTASATVTGYQTNQAGSDYDIEEAYAKEDGRWKLAPAPGTADCQAFNNLQRATPALP